MLMQIKNEIEDEKKQEKISNLAFSGSIMFLYLFEDAIEKNTYCDWKRNCQLSTFNILYNQSGLSLRTACETNQRIDSQQFTGTN